MSTVNKATFDVNAQNKAASFLRDDAASQKHKIDTVNRNQKQRATKDDSVLEYSRGAPVETRPVAPADILQGARGKREPYVHPKPFSQILDYKFIKTLGQGSMGKVKLAQHVRTDQLVAVKIVNRYPQEWSCVPGKKGDPVDPKYAHIPVKLDYDPSRELRILREAFTMKLLNHPNIVKMIDFAMTEHHYYLVFEYVEGTQILDWIVANGRMREDAARNVVRQLLSGIDYCHRNSIVHRDLKIENIMILNSNTSDRAAIENAELLSIQGKTDGTVINECHAVKILDFGLSNYYQSNTLLSTFCGSLYFAAPELLQSQKYIGPEVDIWSLGVITYVLLTSTVPFDDANWHVIHRKIREGKCQYPPYLSAGAISFVKRMLTVNPSLRASIEELKTHPWIQGTCDLVHSVPEQPGVFMNNLGDRLRSISMRSKRQTSVENGRQNSIARRFMVPCPIDSLLPKRVPLGQMAGLHPNPAIVNLLKRDPFEAADIQSSPFVGFSKENGAPAFPASAWADKTTKHIYLSNPLSFGYGKGFGFTAEEVDLALETAMRSPLVLKNPVVSLYYLINEWLQSNSGNTAGIESIPRRERSTSDPGLNTKTGSPSLRPAMMILDSVPQELRVTDEKWINIPVQMTEQAIDYNRGNSRYLKSHWTKRPAKLLCQEFYDLMLEEGFQLADSMLTPRPNNHHIIRKPTHFLTEWTWKPSLVMTGRTSTQTPRFVNFQIEWIEISPEIGQASSAYLRYALRCVQTAGDSEIFERVWERIVWRWSQWNFVSNESQ